ncbi:putative choline transporter, neither null mutation nor overexpression affects choline transport [Arachnomyces sp. PD_36]|nr:putative choline transporter, neither null mutation nor overexpression affects choline transport [Arachnomyces sp. PD_36]
MTQSTDESGQAASYYDAQQSFGAYPQQQQPQPPPPAAQLGHHDNTKYAPPEPKGVVPQRGEYVPGRPPPAPPQPNYQYAGGGGGGGEVPSDEKHTFDQAFTVQKPKFNDLWAGILLILTFCGFVAVSGITIRKYATHMSFTGTGIYNSANNFSLNSNTVVLFCFILVVAFVISWVYFISARAFTKQFIWATGILNIVFALGTAIYYLIKRQWGGGIVFLLFGIFAIVCFVSWIPRIPFSVVMLQSTMDVAKNQGHIFAVSALGGLAAIAFAAWFAVTLVAIYVAYEPAGGGSNPACLNGGCSTAKVIGLIVFVTFAGYWVTEWLKNTIHTTIAGVYGSWYFFSGSAAGIPRGSTRSAFRRSVTYSFGSISFGSLAIAIINTLRQIFSVARSQSGGGGVLGIAGSIMWCMAGCVLAVLDWLITFFNRYAFCHIALYGKAYIPAAKDTWAMMKDRGIDALINDCLISPVLSMGSIFVAYLCALLSYLYLQFTNPSYNNGGAFTAVIMAFAFLIGLQVCQIFLTPIGSGVDTVFVAMAWDPQVMVRDHPELWGKMVSVYPKVQRALHT